jgi:hypothetical protein
VLILDGFSNHDRGQTTAVIKSILSNLMIGLGWRAKEEGIALQVMNNGQCMRRSLALLLHYKLHVIFVRSLSVKVVTIRNGVYPMSGHIIGNSG